MVRGAQVREGVAGGVTRRDVQYYDHVILFGAQKEDTIYNDQFDGNTGQYGENITVIRK